MTAQRPPPSGTIADESLSPEAGASPTPEASDASFGMRVRRAIAWRYGGQIAAQLITWSSTILVVRLLDPSDYGLFAMSQVLVTALAFLNGHSFATSLIRTEHVGEREIGQVFGLLLLLNLGLSGIMLWLGPYAAQYFGEPQVAEILRIQIALFLVVPFIALPDALLSRELQFRPQAYATMAGAITGASIALALAWLGWGVWALVYAPIFAFAARALVVSLTISGWTWPRFDFRGAHAIITFGGALTLCQFFWIIQSQSDIFIAGGAFETYELGLYSEALFVALIITGRFLHPINEVAFPAYAELHHQKRSLAPYFARVQRTVALVVAPLYIGLALTAHEAVATLFGQKWIAMAPLLSNLALIMPVSALQIICSPATNAIGRPQVYLTTSIIGAILFAGCFMAGVHYGPAGLTYAWWVAAPLLLIATLALTLPAIALRLVDLFAAWLPAFAATAIMAAVVSAAQVALPDWAPWWRLALLVALGGASYLATLWLIWPQVVRDAWTMLRRKHDQPKHQPVRAPASAPAPADQTSTIPG